MMKSTRINRFSMLHQPGLVFVDEPADSGGGATGQPGDNPPADTGTPKAPDTGFPAATPVAEMTPPQQAAYWKHQARKHEERADARKDYDQLKDKASKFDKAQQDAETEHEKQLRERTEAAKAEGREAALKESSTKTVRALLEGALRARGMTDVTDDIGRLNIESFLTDGEPDHDAITKWATRLAGQPVSGGLNYGGGNQGGTPSSKPGEAGQAEAEKRFGKKAVA